MGHRPEVPLRDVQEGIAQRVAPHRTGAPNARARTLAGRDEVRGEPDGPRPAKSRRAGNGGRENARQSRGRGFRDGVNEVVSVWRALQRSGGRPRTGRALAPAHPRSLRCCDADAPERDVQGREVRTMPLVYVTVAALLVKQPLQRAPTATRTYNSGKRGPVCRSVSRLADRGAAPSPCQAFAWAATTSSARRGPVRPQNGEAGGRGHFPGFPWHSGVSEGTQDWGPWP